MLEVVELLNALGNVFEYFSYKVPESLFLLFYSSFSWLPQQSRLNQESCERLEGKLNNILYSTENNFRRK